MLSTESRVALTLRVLGGLKTEEIARAFLVSESTVAQRIVRTKRSLAQAYVPFEVPQGADRAAALGTSALCARCGQVKRLYARRPEGRAPAPSAARPGR